MRLKTSIESCIGGDHRVHRPSGLRKIHVFKESEPDERSGGGLQNHGDIRLMGEDIYDKRMDVSLLRRRVGMVFQKPNPFPMSVYDNIAYGPRTHGMRKKAELDEIVEKSLRDAAIWDELKDRLKKSALGLSGGQQQRLASRARWPVKPEVILMDEPDERARSGFHLQN